MRWQLPILTAFVMLCWSLLLAPTYRYHFYFDDLHFIRSYSVAEIASVFHGPNDPDGIELMALRPIATLLFGFQGSMFGENIPLQRLFMALLMIGLMWAVGLLLRTAGFSIRHVAVVLPLFASSRVFASLVLWITMGSLILCYIFMTLTAVFYLRWVSGREKYLLILTLTFAVLAVFTREEAYTLPAALPLIWYVSSSRRGHWQAALTGASGVAIVMAVHFVLRRLFLSDLPRVDLSLHSFQAGYFPALQSSWMPGGYEVIGDADRLFQRLWEAFVVSLVMVALLVAGKGFRMQFLALCALAFVLCAPSLGVPRPYGVAMPSIAFFTAIAAAAIAVDDFTSARGSRLWRVAVASLLALGIAVGITAGIRRSLYVAEALHDNSVTHVIHDGKFLFDWYSEPATIPPRRRQAGLARMAALGIQSRNDLERLEDTLGDDSAPFRARREARAPLFLEKYDYFSF